MPACKECGADVALDENFCGSCGAPVKTDEPLAGSALQSDLVKSIGAGGSTLVPSAEESNAGTGEVSEPEIGATSRSSEGSSRRSKPKALAGGKVLNHRYEIVRRIGGGGMGAVYLAKDRNLGDAPRAVKEMIESHIDETQHEKAIADFKRESLLLTELEHPSIPTVYDYFYDENSERFYLVMKFIPGADLASRLRATPEGRIDEPTVTEWGIQVADVLHYLHTRPQSIIYRDLKPANLMIDSNNHRIMLIDFGIARWVNKKEKGVTAVGTMGYAPPELFSGRADPRVDIYSLGATMFHLLTGADPQDNPLLIFDFTKNPRPRQINPALSSEIERILLRTVE
ncbi:MAG TPA: serine/threonine-protein kinase, partial [Pyrinomonadaceae bacterium]